MSFSVNLNGIIVSNLCEVLRGSERRHKKGLEEESPGNGKKKSSMKTGSQSQKGP